MSDYDLVVVGSGFAGAAATLSFLGSAKNGGRVVLIEAGDPGRWPGASRGARPVLRLDRDNRLSSDWIDRMEKASGEGRILTTAAG